MSTDEQAQEQGQDSPEELAQKKEDEREQAKEKMQEIENGDLPDDVSDWPTGPAKYETFGAEDDAYGDGPTGKLGPVNLKRFPDGSVEVDGERVDNPDDYKGSPIGGSTPGEDGDSG